MDIPEYDYHVPEGCTIVTPESFVTFQEFDDPDLTRFNKAYFIESFQHFKKAATKIGKQVSQQLVRLPELTTQSQAQDEVLITVFRNWDNAYVNGQNEISQKHVDRIYDHFRRSKKVFGVNDDGSFDNASFADIEIPDAVFGLDDTRAIEYFNQSQNLFLSKFITDGDTRERILNQIGADYIEGILPLGNTALAEEFAEDFADLIVLEGWKVRRIIDTTVNKVRNYANINYIDQSEVTNYEIVELLDNRTCAWCQHMDGKKFSIVSAKNKIDKEIGAGAGGVGITSPFATSVKIEDFITKDVDSLAADGHVVPTFHPHCRGRVVADI